MLTSLFIIIALVNVCCSQQPFTISNGCMKPVMKCATENAADIISKNIEDLSPRILMQACSKVATFRSCIANDSLSSKCSEKDWKMLQFIGSLCQDPTELEKHLSCAYNFTTNITNETETSAKLMQCMEKSSSPLEAMKVGTIKAFYACAVHVPGKKCMVEAFGKYCPDVEAMVDFVDQKLKPIFYPEREDC